MCGYLIQKGKVLIEFIAHHVFPLALVLADKGEGINRRQHFQRCKFETFGTNPFHNSSIAFFPFFECDQGTAQPSDIDWRLMITNASIRFIIKTCKATHT